MLTRIGDELCVDLDKCAIARSSFDGDPCMNIYFFGERRSFTQKRSPKEYGLLEKFLNAQETLESRNLRQIREEAWDPFNEMPPTLFSLFSSLPNHGSLSLVLYSDGRGCVNGFLDEGQEELDKLYWVGFTEALEKLQAYKNAVSEPVPMSEPFDIDPFLDEID